MSVFSGNRSDDITVITRKLFILNLQGSHTYLQSTIPTAAGLMVLDDKETAVKGRASNRHIHIIWGILP
jgi:hypothetical protein